MSTIDVARPGLLPRRARPRRGALVALLFALLFALVAAVPVAAVVATAAAAAPPTYVVAGDDPSSTGAAWGFHEAYFSELRSVLTSAANFGAGGVVDASFVIAAPRSVPLTARSLDGIDVYVTSARDISTTEGLVLRAFVLRGGALVVNSNAPGFFDQTAWLGFGLSPRVVYGDGAAPYTTTHRAPAASQAVTTHPIFSGPFGTASSFENWHSVAGFTSTPAHATTLARTTLTGPADNGSSQFITISNVATLAVTPANAFTPGSGPIIATSDVDTFSNAYTYAVGTNDPDAIGYPGTDALNTLTGTTNGVIARNAFAWLASQLGAARAPSGGLLRVVTSPAVPSQILVNGVPTDTWGLTWMKLAAGAHEVCFRDVPGYATPACQQVNVAVGATTTVTGAFTRLATLRVTTSPAVPSTISVDGVPRNDWGVWTDLPAGAHQVCFGPVAGFTPPACQNVTLVAGTTTTVTGAFTAQPGAAGPSGLGSLRVVTSPAVPSQVLVDGVVRDTWSTWVSLAPGAHVVCFTAIEGFSTPPCQNVTVTAGATTNVTGQFAARGYLRVITNPAAGGTIVVDDVGRNDWGMWTDLPPGPRTVCFGAVPGRLTPACQSVTVTAGTTTTVTGTYV